MAGSFTPAQRPQLPGQCIVALVIALVAVGIAAYGLYRMNFAKASLAALQNQYKIQRQSWIELASRRSPWQSPCKRRTSPAIRQMFSHRSIVQTSRRSFTLTFKEPSSEIVDGTTYDFWTFDGTVPGPMLRVMGGDCERLFVKLRLSERDSVPSVLIVAEEA